MSPLTEYRPLKIPGLTPDLVCLILMAVSAFGGALVMYLKMVME